MTPRVYLAAYRDGMSTRYQEVGPEDMGAEAFVPEGSVVRVKPMEWQEGKFCGQDMFYADTPSGTWMVVCYSGRGFRWAICDSRGDDSDEDWSTPELAKAAAQADYEARIRAALDLTTEPEPTRGWQPIETAPKDGREVLLYHPDLGMAAWPWWGRESTQGPWHEVTHWQPLPPAPDDHDGGNPTSGAYDMICCTAEDVATGRGFTGDAAADLATAQESLRVCLGLLGWRG